MNEKRVVCAVILRDGAVFLVRRAPGQTHAGQWEFPGGKREDGETDEACLEREMLEEFGLTGRTGARVGENVCVYPELSLRITLCAYRFTPRPGGGFSLRVHDKARFVAAHEVWTLPLSPADVPIARAALTLL